MATERKSHDIVLSEVRKLAGYGKLVAVLQLTDGKRELRFQHDDQPEIVRCVEIDLSTGEPGKATTISTKAQRDR